MFRFEKIFQNDDNFFINLTIILKPILIFFSIYIYLILEQNTIYDLLKYDIFNNSEYFLFSYQLTIIFFCISFVVRQKKKYKINFLSFLKYDFFPLLISYLFSVVIINLFNEKLNFSDSFIYVSILIFINLFLINRMFYFFYNFLIESNIIQRNIMLVGNPNNIKKFLYEKKDKINIYKCCLINSKDKSELKKYRNDIKIPVFNQEEDIRSILEYHSLGQVWILDDNKEDKHNFLNSVLKFSVDILIINLNTQENLNSYNLINNKYKFEEYEISKFYGFNLFLKILIDKILSLIFLILLSPVIIISLILIYIEDGYPLIFTQDRTGWDGRRFKIYKLRSLKKEKFDKTIQVKKDDNRLLKIGKIIRRLSIDELPQFYNVLKGDMSIVGPRPHMVEHDIHYSSMFKNFLKRHKSNPGLTGWAQVNGLRGGTPANELMKKRMDLDLWYLNNWSIWLDLYIIFKTFYVIFKYKGD